MKHDEGIEGATFTKDEQWVLTWSSDGTMDHRILTTRL